MRLSAYSCFHRPMRGRVICLQQWPPKMCFLSWTLFIGGSVTATNTVICLPVDKGCRLEHGWKRIPMSTMNVLLQETRSVDLKWLQRKCNIYRFMPECSHCCSTNWSTARIARSLPWPKYRCVAFQRPQYLKQRDTLCLIKCLFSGTLYHVIRGVLVTLSQF